MQFNLSYEYEVSKEVSEVKVFKIHIFELYNSIFGMIHFYQKRKTRRKERKTKFQRKFYKDTFLFITRII